MLTFSKFLRYLLFLRHPQTIVSLRNQALDRGDPSPVLGQVVGLEVQAVAGAEATAFLAVARERNPLVPLERRKEGLALEQAMAAQARSRLSVRTDPAARQGMVREGPLDSCRHSQISISRTSLFYCVDT